MKISDLVKEDRSQVIMAQGTDVGVQLKRLFSEKGDTFLSDKERIRNEVYSLQLEDNIKAQLCLFLGCKVIHDFVENSKVSIDFFVVNNLIHSVLLETGLSYDTTVKCVSELLFALGLDIPIEYSPVSANDILGFNIHALIPVDITRQWISDVFRSYNEFTQIRKPSEIEIKEFQEKLNHLCDSGISDGLFLKGVLYKNGEVGVVQDLEKARTYLQLAADMGNSNASAFLADNYFSGIDSFIGRDYTTAEYYYTRMGACPINDITRRTNLQTIHQQKRINLENFLFSFVLLVLTVGFVVFFHKSFSGEKNILPVGIIASILSLGVIVKAILYNLKKKFNSNALMLIVQGLIWMVYVLILVLI